MNIRKPRTAKEAAGCESDAAIQHQISIAHEPGRRSGALVTSGGHRAQCSCGWWSDCYAQLSDTQRAVEVHLRRPRREDGR